MVFHFEIDGERVSVALEPRGPRRFLARVGARDYEVDYVQGNLLVGGRSLEYTRVNGGTSARVAVGGAEVVLTTPALRHGKGKGTGPGSGTVCAPMNGQVVKLLRERGERIRQGEVVLTLEAMKMENEVAAPCSGKLLELCVTEGQAVEPGVVLFRVEPDGD